MKQVGLVTGHQFSFLYIGGVPFNPSKVKRFLDKGSGIKLQDLVIFEAGEDRVLDFIKNAKYMDTVEEKRMVKEFVRASELQMANLRTGEVSEQMKKDLAEEGLFITNDGAVTNVPAEYKDPAENFDVLIFDDSTQEGFRATDFDPALLAAMTPDQRRTLSILLQSSLKIALDMQSVEVDFPLLKATALDLAEWVDNNSTGIIRTTKSYLKK